MQSRTIPRIFPRCFDPWRGAKPLTHQKRPQADRGLHINSRQPHLERDRNCVPDQTGHHALSRVIGMHVRAINVAVGIEFEKARNLPVPFEHERLFPFTATLPVTWIRSLRRPRQALLLRVICRRDLVHCAAKNFRNRDVIAATVWSDHLLMCTMPLSKVT